MSVAMSKSCSAVAPSVWELFFSFLRLGAISFGGPVMVSYIKEMAVEQKEWLSEAELQSGVALCQTIPGATSMQCAAYVGWKTRRLRGAVASYLGFALPAFLLMLVLSVAYQKSVDAPLFSSIFGGLRAVVVALIVNAAWSFGRATLKRPLEALVAAATALAFLGGYNTLLIVLCASLVGSLWFQQGAAKTDRPLTATLGWSVVGAPALIALVIATLLAVAHAAGRGLDGLGLVMVKTDLLAFGGGFAAIPIMFHEIVEARGWLSAQAFLDGIALGQITPGPIVITSTFVGYQVHGYPGAVVATSCMLLPSLFVLLLTEPWFERLQSSSRFRGAARGALVSFAGLLVSVAIRFGKGVTWDVGSVVIAGAALVALRRRVNVVWVVAVGALIPLGRGLLGL